MLNTLQMDMMLDGLADIFERLDGFDDITWCLIAGESQHNRRARDRALARATLRARRDDREYLAEHVLSRLDDLLATRCPTHPTKVKLEVRDALGAALLALVVADLIPPSDYHLLVAPMLRAGSGSGFLPEIS